MKSKANTQKKNVRSCLHDARVITLFNDIALPLRKFFYSTPNFIVLPYLWQGASSERSRFRRNVFCVNRVIHSENFYFILYFSCILWHIVLVHNTLVFSGSIWKSTMFFKMFFDRVKGVVDALSKCCFSIIVFSFVDEHFGILRFILTASCECIFSWICTRKLVKHGSTRW